MTASNAVNRRIMTELKNLRKTIETTDPNAVKFIVDTISDDDPKLITKPGQYVIVGRILPNEGVYKQAAFQLKLTLLPEFPFKGPELNFVTPMYHPNVDEKGQICVEILNTGEGWRPTTTLIDVVKAVVNLINKPDIDHALNLEIANEYNTKRADFDRKALAMVQKHGLPRN